MKIICNKHTDVQQMLARIKHLLESECADYPMLAEDLVLELSLQKADGTRHTDTEPTIRLEEKDLQNISHLEYHYDHDALTKLYNRGKYERDLTQLEAKRVSHFTCIYIDVIGLHEINNHLGHAAGDAMLCSIAKGIRTYFPSSTAYRIGGDEFVIFCLHPEEAVIKQALSDLIIYLKKDNYEISVGMETNRDGHSLLDTVNKAEHAMRYDKAAFYKHDGAKRQMRGLNHKLEKILLENQDTNQFLNVIASEYKGVYMVNPKTDTCRNIFIPEYFKQILKENNDSFSRSIRAYSDRFVCDKDKVVFQQVFDLETIRRQIKQGNAFKITYDKKDGGKIHLQITIYDATDTSKNEMLWIFMDGNFDSNH